MSVPWAKRLSGRADVKFFPGTQAPIMLLAPNRAGVPIYGQPRATIVFMPPASAVRPLPPPPPPPRPPVPPLSIVYHNQAQTCTNTCPDGTTGDPIVVTTPANQPEYNSPVSQDDANEQAMTAACAQAAAERTETPCVGDVPSIAAECQVKVGTCTGVIYTLDNVIFDGITICATATGCADMFGQFAQACASADVAGATIVDGYPTFTFNNFQWTNVLQIFSLGCGISGQHPSKGPGSFSAVPGGGQTLTSISATVNTLTVTSNPAYNPYTIGMAIFFDLVGTEVTALPELTLDLTALVSNYCYNTVPENPEIPWVPASCASVTAYIEQVGEDEYNYSFLQTRYVLGADTPLVIGQNYRLTTFFARRAAGSADPFVVIGEDNVLEFEAEATEETTDWIDVPNELGFETKVFAYQLEPI